MRNLEVEVKARTQDVFSQEAALAALGDGQREPLDCQRVLRPAVDVALVRAYCPGANDHSFDDRVRIAFQHAPVHEGSGVALVRVAQEVLDL